MDNSKTLVLIDGSSYLYRAYHALPALTTSDGSPTGAIYGVLNMVRKTREQYPSAYIGVVFDAKGKTFRDELFEQYKANRPAMDDDLANQVSPLLDIIEAQGLPLLMEEGVEADDVIATLANQANHQGLSVIISTGDKDLAQLVNGGVKLVNTMSDKWYDRDSVIDKFGIPPERVIDYLALVGDTSDNVPGVPSVGPKTAVKWLNFYGSLDEIINYADDIKGKIGEKLRDNLSQLELSRRLVTLDHNLELDWAIEDLRPAEPDQDKLMELYRRYELRQWLNELLERQADNIELDYQLITEQHAFDNLLEQLKQAAVIAIDTETTSLQSVQADIVGLSFSIEPRKAVYLPVAHTDGPQQLNKQWVLDRLRPVLEDPERPKLGHNLKYDITVLANEGIELKGVCFDTMIESYVLNPSANRHDMDSVVLYYLGERTTQFTEVAGKGKNQLTFDAVPVDQAYAYACEDADMALRLHQKLWPAIENKPTLREAFETIEMPLVPVLARMERIGVAIDVDELKRQSHDLGERMQQLEDKAYQLAGQTFNLGSPKQLQQVLYEKGGLPVLQKTPKGQPSTSESVLQQLAEDYALPQVILEYRSLSKLKSTYTDKLPEQIVPATGRVHTSYNQAVTSTGRLSSTEPNLQNIPIRTEQGRMIRRAFIADNGSKIVSADYSQIELRIMAHISGDEGLKRAFANDLDIHSATASEVFGVAFDEVTDNQRRSAKAINFGLLYGMSAYGLAQQLGIEPGQANAYINRYFERYPGVRRYMDNVRAQAAEKGYVETMFGRRLYVPEIHSNNPQRQRAAERAAINAPMQGSAADIIKRAMIEVDQWIVDSGLAIKMVMQVHDELIFEVAQQDIDTACQTVPELMSQAATLNVPLIADVGVGDSWADAH